ncbi:hypothetical protein DICSQDRAFT_177237 [Dichomitus squalens LYAD-421 SS1]|uniref:uncharacterized protein n=1 Tax=Dichomitus squalens (strain LYAD-421) TaxID=732165 RepID=UPI0004410C83|nr:uncharacterized protein DICSQDRAFT_177237 [Dichomitus squalens LYAD-421 SS1]EJF65802.1 hypothetical protein DICSQDRAFT_177237 [Dichomitus squalens LYAD-421 SS1]
MPLDILVEVFSFMHPGDLLNLARTTKDFRAFLMSRTSAPFWKSARQTVEGLPDCPPYLSEPAYANLMFFALCHHCLKSNIQNALFELSVRYCRDCQRYLLIDVQETDYRMDEVVIKMGFEEPYLTSVILSRDSVDRLFYHRPEYENFRNFCFLVQDEAELVRSIKDRIASVQVISESCEALYAWKEAQVQNRAQELDRLREERFTTIIDFLRKDGWGDELDRMEPEDLYELAEKPYARKPQKLTRRGESLVPSHTHAGGGDGEVLKKDSGWASICEDAHAFMEDVQSQRLKMERRALLHDRLVVFVGLLDVVEGQKKRPYLADPEDLGNSEYDKDDKRSPEDDLQPRIADYAMMPSLREVLDDPGDHPVTEDHLWQLRDHQAALIVQWKQTLQNRLVEKLRAAIALPDDIDDPLSLAIASFSCLACHRSVPLRYPELLAHRCLRRLPIHMGTADLYTMTMNLRKVVPQFSSPVTLDYVHVDRQVVERLTAVIDTLGLDPLHATQHDLERCEGRMYCAYGKCQTETGDLLQLRGCNWLSALLHMEEVHNETSACGFRLLDEHEAVQVARLEETVKSHLDSIAGDRTFLRRACRFCPKRFLSRTSLVNHLESQHSVDIEDDLDGYFYIPLDERTQRLPKIYVCYDLPDRRYRDVGLPKGWRDLL